MFENPDEAKANKEARNAIEANEAQQIQMAKRLPLMTLSNFKKVTNPPLQPLADAWDKSMAVALSHCSRVVLTLPKQEKTPQNKEEKDNKNSAAMHANMWQSIFTTMGTVNERDNRAQDNPRGFSTHILCDARQKMVSQKKRR